MARVVIFDFDGVIADTERVHMSAFREVLAPMGIAFSDAEYFSKYLALDDRTFFQTLLAENGVNADVPVLVREKSLLTQSGISESHLFNGVDALIRSVSFEGLAMAVASGALRGEIETVLSNADLLNLFDFVVSAEDCKKCKPDPEAFVRALEGVNGNLNPGASTGQCVVIEDSVHGIEAARAAGMKCVAVANSHPRELLAEADMVVDSAAEIDAAWLASF